MGRNVYFSPEGAQLHSGKGKRVLFEQLLLDFFGHDGLLLNLLASPILPGATWVLCCVAKFGRRTGR